MTNTNGQWRITKEKILMFFGILLIAFEAVLASLGKASPLTWEFLLVGAAFCGISITQWGDKK